MTITLVVAVARNGVIGRDGQLPWHLPEDLAHFKRVTLGGTMIMGRKTFDSIGRPLPGRRSIVVTRQPSWAADGVTMSHSFHEALDAAGAVTDVFVIGGAELFREALPLADRIELTEVHQSPDGDTYFPELDPAQWQEVRREPHERFDFVIYHRVA